MKRVLLMICSVCLVLACLFGLFACVAGVKDIMNIKTYKEEDLATAEEGIATARDGIKQLMENEDVYLEGVSTYEAGLSAYYDGKQQLADGYKQYEAGKQKLADGYKQYNEGKALLDANTQAYNEGKEKIATLEQYMPYIEAIDNATQNVRDTNKSIIGNDADKALGTLRANALKLAADSAAVAAISDLVGMDIGDLLESNPEDTSICGNIVDMYYDGLAQLKQYEDGLAQLIAAEKQLADGEKQLKDAEGQLADGEAQLADGAAQLADGDAQLSVYEDGQAQLAAGMEQFLEEMAEVTTRSGKKVVPGLAELLGDDFSIWVLDENGDVKVERGCQFVDLESCSKLLDEAEHYLELSGVDTKGELYPRIATYAMIAIACIFGIIGGIVGLVSAINGQKKNGYVAGLICAILAVAANVVGVFTGYTDFAYQTREVVDGVKEYTYSGDLQLAAMIVLAVVAVIFTIVASAARKAAKKAEAACAAEANEAAVAGAAAAVAEAPEAEEKVADLEAENAALKEMVAKLAADAATVQE